MTEKEKLSECLRVLNFKNRDTLTKSILDGGKETLGGLFWSIFFEYRIQATSYDGINGHVGLLKWCQKKSVNRVNDFTTSWANGVVLNVLVRNLWAPDLQDKISPDTKAYNLNMALELGYKHGVPRIVEATDFCFSNEVTRKLMMIYLDSVYTTAQSVSHKRTNAEATSTAQNTKKLCLPATAPYTVHREFLEKKFVGTLMEDIKHFQPTSFYVEYLDKVQTEAQELESKLQLCSNKESGDAVKDLLKKLATEKIKVLEAIIDICNGPGGSFHDLQTSLTNWKRHRNQIVALGFQSSEG